MRRHTGSVHPGTSLCPSTTTWTSTMMAGRPPLTSSRSRRLTWPHDHQLTVRLCIVMRSISAFLRVLSCDGPFVSLHAVSIVNFCLAHGSFCEEPSDMEY